MFSVWLRCAYVLKRYVLVGGVTMVPLRKDLALFPKKKKNPILIIKPLYNINQQKINNSITLQSILQRQFKFLCSLDIYAPNVDLTLL